MRPPIDSLSRLAFQIDAPRSHDPFRVIVLRGYYANVGYRVGLVLPQYATVGAEMPNGACFFVNLGDESNIFLQVLHARLKPNFPCPPMAPKVNIQNAVMVRGIPVNIGSEPVVLEGNLGLEPTTFRIGFDLDGRLAALQMPELQAGRMLFLAALGGIQLENLSGEQ